VLAYAGVGSLLGALGAELTGTAAALQGAATLGPLGIGIYQVQHGLAAGDQALIAEGLMNGLSAGAFLGEGLGAGPRATVREAVEARSALARAARAANNLTAANEAIEHVLERHAFGSPAARAGKYAANADIPGLIKSTVRDGIIRPGNAMNPNAVVFEASFANPIGKTINGADAYRMRVVLGPNGSLITAFPF